MLISWAFYLLFFRFGELWFGTWNTNTNFVKLATEKNSFNLIQSSKICFLLLFLANMFCHAWTYVNVNKKESSLLLLIWGALKQRFGDKVLWTVCLQMCRNLNGNIHIRVVLKARCVVVRLKTETAQKVSFREKKRNVSSIKMFALSHLCTEN